MKLSKYQAKFLLEEIKGRLEGDMPDSEIVDIITNFDINKI